MESQSPYRVNMFVIHENKAMGSTMLSSQSPYRVNMFVMVIQNAKKAKMIMESQSPYRVNMFVIKDDTKTDDDTKVSIPLSGQYVCNDGNRKNR